MILSDVSVKRPVFAAVISLLLLAFGILSFRELPLREYPDLSSPIVSISTSYRGASAAVVETKITQVVEDQISGIEGVASIRSSSSDGSSRISIEFDISRDIDQAANDVRDKVARVVGRLPEDVDPPQIAKSDSDARPIQYFSLTSTTMDSMALTDYADRYIRDHFAVIDGVASVGLSGAGRYSMRIWLDRIALAARGLTVNDVESALRKQNLELPAGRIDSAEREFTVRVQRSYQTVEDFANLVLGRGADGHLMRLGEVAKVEVGPASLRSEFRGNGVETVSLSIVKQSTANTLEVLRATNAKTDQINQSLPEGMELEASSDDSIFIENAISSVYKTLAITMVLVSLVIYMFLGTVRAMVIPAVTIPVCLTAAFIILAAFDYSVNLITLLGLVLAIGLVVDDSIVVLENVQRRIEEGEPPLLAAFHGSRQVAFAVIATTLVLLAVFVPITFLEGNIGVIFAELAITVGSAVVFSSVLALSLTAMLSSKLLNRSAHESWLTRKVDDYFHWLQRGYHDSLQICLPRPIPVITCLVLILVGIFLLLREIPTAFAPQEDQGIFIARVSGPEGASFGFMKRQMRKIEETVIPHVEAGDVNKFLVFLPGWGSGGGSVNSGIILVTMVPWEDRVKSTVEVKDELAREWQKIPAVRAFPFMRSGLSRGGGGQQVQFVLGGSTYTELAEWRDILLARAAANPGLTRVQSDYKETKPQLLVEVDKVRAADMGVSIQTIGRTLQTMMSERRVTTYVDGGEEYDVILQANVDQRASPDDLTNIYVKSETSGRLIPLANLTTIANVADAGSLNRYNRLRAITISANLAPGYTLGQALSFLENVVRDELPIGAQIDYKGESLELKESKGGMMFTFTLALLVVFLVLAAQFESFVHPVVIMATVPLATFGALLGIFLTGQTLNIYSEIGLIILVGISTKNGILIVEFANQLRDQGKPFEEALLEAADIRLRPVLMTALSTMMGSIPLILASGAGSESRMTLGIVIFSGVLMATVLTLFVVPVFYRLLARGTGSPGEVAARLEEMGEQPVGVR
ncbi:MAG: efflux RND transporter permease subunit [Pseudomonadales bacterium]|jgi:multidrug efflux pump|nr:efflux RND transporter permease subunit [Pseudomonadales bacterium]MDP7594509.1 efflux RND transporter permease subunit [Pseudomonadales bacterium]HJN52719.1 efflux RND transporter permease subunit [Pseudomonadales bacterium]